MALVTNSKQNVSKPITNGTNLVQGAVEEIHENQRTYEIIINNSKIKNQKKRGKTFVGKRGTIFSRIEGLNGSAFTLVLSTTVIQIV